MYQINQIFADGAYFQLTALLTGALFFAMVGIREMKNENLYGYLFAAISIFFLAIHAFFLLSLPDAVSPLNNLDFWPWLIAFFAPALITLYLVFGFFNMLMDKVRLGIVKIFFGLTLLCYLFMLGGSWPLDVKGIIVMIWCGLWFDVELGLTA